MSHKAFCQGGPPKAVKPNEILKVIALIYLKEALIAEDYEVCPKIVQEALSFGAILDEISNTIAEYFHRVNCYA